MSYILCVVVRASCRTVDVVDRTIMCTSRADNGSTPHATFLFLAKQDVQLWATVIFAQLAVEVWFSPEAFRDITKWYPSSQLSYHFCL